MRLSHELAKKKQIHKDAKTLSFSLHLKTNDSSLKKEYLDMKTKRKPKIEQNRNLENFFETNWLKQSDTTYKQAQKRLNDQKSLSLLMRSRLCYIVTEIKAKRKKRKKSIFKKFIFKSLKQTAIN